MEKAKSTVVPGNLLYEYVKQYNYAVRGYNKYNKDSYDELDWNDVVNRLNSMKDCDKTIVQNIIKQSWKAFFDSIKSNLHPQLDRILETSAPRN